MSSRGLSLVGFMDHLHAIAHLRFACVPADPSDAALAAEWQKSILKLQLVNIPTPGRPNIQQIPASDQHYIQDFIREPWVRTELQSLHTTYQFMLVEIDPILSFQHVVNLDRVDHHFRSLPRTIGTSDLLPICLPTAQQTEDLYVSPVVSDSHSVIIKSRNTGLNRTIAGVFPLDLAGYRTHLAGMRFDFSQPFVHVVQFRGRCYLHNGFHRAIGARRAGATHVPCIFRTVNDYNEVGVRSDGNTFTAKELDSATPPCPPTVGHFTQGGAWDVALRNVSRILHVTWSEHTVPDE
jgi:hypothetical protein